MAETEDDPMTTDRQTKRLTIALDGSGDGCQSCKQKISKRLHRFRGVSEVQYHPESSEITVVYDAASISKSELLAGVEDMGYSIVQERDTRSAQDQVTRISGCRCRGRRQHRSPVHATDPPTTRTSRQGGKRMGCQCRCRK